MASGPQPAVVLAKLLLVEGTIDGLATGLMLIDSGSSQILLSPPAFPSIALPKGSAIVDELAVAGLVARQVPVLDVDLWPEQSPPPPIGAVLGCDLLCNYSVALNYRDHQVTFGTTPTPTGVEDVGASAMFALEGGSGSKHTRIVLAATIEGQQYSVLLDTGSSYLGLRSSVFESIARDGRAQQSTAALSAGSAGAGSATRLHTVTVAGASVSGVVATEQTSSDQILDGISAEVGQPVDGLLGGAFLDQFFVTIGYATGEVRLQRYTAGAPAYDGFERIGVSLAGAGTTGGCPVTGVITGTDAARIGVSVGDTIVSIDGQSLASSDALSATERLAGVPGSTKMLQFGTAQSSALAGQTVSVAVDELLPL